MFLHGVERIAYLRQHSGSAMRAMALHNPLSRLWSSTAAQILTGLIDQEPQRCQRQETRSSCRFFAARAMHHVYTASSSSVPGCRPLLMLMLAALALPCSVLMIRSSHRSSSSVPSEIPAYPAAQGLRALEGDGGAVVGQPRGTNI